MESENQPPEVITKKLKSRIEGAIAIAWLLIFGLLLKSTSLLFADAIDEQFGDKSGMFGLTVVLPAIFLLTAFIVIVGSYWVIALLYGKNTAEELTFSWRKRKHRTSSF